MKNPESVAHTTSVIWEAGEAPSKCSATKIKSLLSDMMQIHVQKLTRFPQLMANDAIRNGCDSLLFMFDQKEGKIDWVLGHLKIPRIYAYVLT